MARCPNCGRETKRTDDWACQWCGYPLLSGGYKKLEQSYREAKGEPVYRPEAPEEEIEEAPPRPMKAPRTPEPEPEPEPVVESTTPTSPVAPAPEPVAPPPPPPVVEPLAPPRPNPIMSAEACPMELEVTTEEITLAFQSDKALADSKLANRVLKVTGIIDKIFVKEHLDIQYLLLTTPAKTDMFNVRCTFDKKLAYQLRRLNPGEKVTVQGKYNGCERNIILKDCVLVK